MASSERISGTGPNVSDPVDESQRIVRWRGYRNQGRIDEIMWRTEARIVAQRLPWEDRTHGDASTPAGTMKVSA